jgi:hypothetical protein
LLRTAHLTRTAWALATLLAFGSGAALAEDPQQDGAAAPRSTLTTLYDTDHPVTLTGPIVEVEWTAPRARLHMMDTATGQRWVVVGGSPYDLTAEQRASVKVGDDAIVVAYPARNTRCKPACTAFGDIFTRADGSSLVKPTLPPHP